MVHAPKRRCPKPNAEGRLHSLRALLPCTDSLRTSFLSKTWNRRSATNPGSLNRSASSCRIGTLSSTPLVPSPSLVAISWKTASIFASSTPLSCLTAFSWRSWDRPWPIAPFQISHRRPISMAVHRSVPRVIPQSVPSQKKFARTLCRVYSTVPYSGPVQRSHCDICRWKKVLFDFVWIYAATTAHRPANLVISIYPFVVRLTQSFFCRTRHSNNSCQKWQAILAALSAVCWLRNRNEEFWYWSWISPSDRLDSSRIIFFTYLGPWCTHGLCR